jgi:hypothetical protein
MRERERKGKGRVMSDTTIGGGGSQVSEAAYARPSDKRGAFQRVKRWEVAKVKVFKNKGKKLGRGFTAYDRNFLCLCFKGEEHCDNRLGNI